jgi:hypothetical protein
MTNEKATKDMLCMDVARSGRSVTGFEFDIDIDVDRPGRPSLSRAATIVVAHWDQ